MAAILYPVSLHLPLVLLGAQVHILQASLYPTPSLHQWSDAGIFSLQCHSCFVFPASSGSAPLLPCPLMDSWSRSCPVLLPVLTFSLFLFGIELLLSEAPLTQWLCSNIPQAIQLAVWHSSNSMWLFHSPFHPHPDSSHNLPFSQMFYHIFQQALCFFHICTLAPCSRHYIWSPLLQGLHMICPSF